MIVPKKAQKMSTPKATAVVNKANQPKGEVIGSSASSCSGERIFARAASRKRFCLENGWPTVINSRCSSWDLRKEIQDGANEPKTSPGLAPHRRSARSYLSNADAVWFRLTKFAQFKPSEITPGFSWRTVPPRSLCARFGAGRRRCPRTVFYAYIDQLSPMSSACGGLK